MLAGRYRLEERVRTGADGSLWRAVDETLDRPVSVRIVRPGHRYTADVIDAARRAALVEDARLVRVLDVGESGGSAYVVSEHLVGRTLAELLTSGPVPVETTRRLIGEAASALDRASARGLHHLQLTPDSLVIIPDGGVKVLGTAIEAALAGLEHDEDPLGADRLDAVGLVRLLYAGITGRWPGAVDSPLGPAPRVTGRVVPPSDLAADVPDDLDTLCTVTLGPHDDGLCSPGELAEQLAPWAPAGPLTDPDGQPSAGPVRPTAASLTAVPAGRPLDGRGPLAGHGSVPASSREVRTVTGSAAAESSTTSSSTTGSSTTRFPPLVPGDAGGPETSHANSGPTAVNGRSTPAWSSGTRDAGPDDWALLSQTVPVPEREPAPQAEPLGPFIPHAPIARPPQDQARFVLGVVAGVVVVGLILAIFSLRGLFLSAEPLMQPAPFVSPGTTAAVQSAAVQSAAGAPPPATASPEATASPTSTPTPSPSETPAEVSGIQAIDPQGDGDENGSTAVHAIDGDKSTNWRSARYQSAGFGGLKKGLGLYLKLSTGPITSVTIDMPGHGGSVELRTANGPGLDSSVVVATAQGTNGTAVLTPSAVLPAGPLLLWFTELPRQDSGEFRLVVTEITVA